MKRFILMATLGAMLCGSMIAGCGGSDEDTSATGGNAVGGNAVGGNPVGGNPVGGNPVDGNAVGGPLPEPPGMDAAP